MAPLRTLLSELIDYAGLFPPAALPLGQVVADYAEARGGRDAWALGRLIVPTARLADLATLLDRTRPTAPWPISALAGPDLAADLAMIELFSQAHSAIAQVDTLELQATDAAALLSGDLLPPPGLTVYVEVPTAADPTALLERIVARRLRAKVRCGGVVAAAFPTPDALASWLAVAIAIGVPFKATAGLHHPLRGAYRLTYAPASATAPMYGYLNLLLAAAALRAGADLATARQALLEADPQALTWDDGGLAWRALRFGPAELTRLRAESMLSVGSCSFDEPLSEIAQLYGVL